MSVRDSWQISVLESLLSNPVVSVSQMTVLGSASRSAAHSDALVFNSASASGEGFIFVGRGVDVVVGDFLTPFDDF